MKKVLALLLVCLLATSVAFAAVQFSGSLTAGAAINYDADTWTIYTYGDDGDGTDEMSLNFTIGDDQGLWSADVKGLWGNQLYSTDNLNSEQLFGESGKIEAIFRTNLAKSIATAVGGESPIDVTLEIGGNRRVTTFRAYNNVSGASLDRVRTLDNTNPFGVTIGYQDFVQAQVTYAPKWVDDGGFAAGSVYGYNEDLTASAIVKPYTGIALSVDYAMKGESKVLANKYELVGGVYETAADAGGLLGAALDVNIGELIGADFNIGLSVSDRYEFGTKYNQFAAVVYGGIDMVSAYVEYALRSYGQDFYQQNGEEGSYTYTVFHDKDKVENYFNVGVDLALVDNMNLDLYFGADDCARFQDSYFVGGNIGYTLNGVKYNLGVEYNQGNWNGIHYDYEGLLIVPSVSVSF